MQQKQIYVDMVVVGIGNNNISQFFVKHNAYGIYRMSWSSKLCKLSKFNHILFFFVFFKTEKINNKKYTTGNINCFGMVVLW